MPGQVVHFEIPADDAERAQSFYRDVFGWTMMSLPEMQYTMVTTGPVGDNGMPSEPGFINGGMFIRTADLGAPVVTLMVDDIDEALASVEAAGGSTVMGRQSVGDMGFSAYFKDTEGNVIGIWQTAG